MTLTNRVSSFFLGWLGFSLVGFAVTVYFLARSNAYHRADERLEGTLNTLAAAAETDARGVEWEPHERELPRSADGPLWIVSTRDGAIVDRSVEVAEWLRPQEKRGSSTISGPSGSRWRVAQRGLLGSTPGQAVEAKPSEVRYPSLELVTALPLEPIESELRNLGIWLGLNTLILWLLAALIGRWLCRRTLAPVTQMATAAASLGPNSPGERLEVKPTDDELGDLGQAFNGVLDRLEEAFDRQQRFTGDAAHQLRTPLAAMLGQVEVALRRDRESGEYRETLQTVAGEIRHLHRLTESLLFLARADADAAHPDLQEIDLAGWVEAHVADWRTRFPTLLVESDGSASKVRAHPELLAQLVENLLDNAVKYGQPAGHVTLRFGSVDGRTELAVEDAGPGISQTDLPHIFDPFFRSASARAAGIRGVGLGLAIARRIASAMRAELTLESGEGHGSRFIIRFVE